MTTVHSGRYMYYRCCGVGSYTSKTCKAKMLRADVIDDAVWKAILQAAQEPSAGQTTPGNTSIYVDAEKRLKQLSSRHGEIMKWFRDGLLESDEVEKELRQLKQERADLDALLARQKKPSAKLLTKGQISAALTTTQKRALLLSVDMKVEAAHTGTDLLINFISSEHECSIMI